MQRSNSLSCVPGAGSEMSSVTLADPDLEVRRRVVGAVLFCLPALPAFLPSVIPSCFCPKWGPSSRFARHCINNPVGV